MKLLAGLLLSLGVFAVAIGIALVVTYPLMLVINYTFAPSLLTAIFGVAKLTFWKTFLLPVAIGVFKSNVTVNK